MARSNLKTTTFDAEELKQSLIEYLQSTNEFGDFNYEGSVINTIIDLLVRNTTYDAFLANMLANESFIQSAQIRGNVSAHAQKLSYVPRSRTASRIIANIRVSPTDTIADTTTRIKADAGAIFLSSVGGNTYTFTTKDSYTLSYSNPENKFTATDVELFQGQLIVSNVEYTGTPIVVDNTMIDTSTLTVEVNGENFAKADSISDFGTEQRIFFLRERTDGKFEIDFGGNVFGKEPEDYSEIAIRYVNTEENHANGIKNLISGSTIDGYSNIVAEVTTPSYGGQDQESIDMIRFMAPKMYQAQDRALSTSDYVTIVKNQFPFIKSAISWGGEDNNPPRYGVVFISILLDNGIILTDTLSRQIETSIKDKSVGSVTPVVTHANVIEMSLSIDYKFNSSKTRKKKGGVEDEIKSIVYDYSDSDMYMFGRYYNEAELIRLLKDEPYIETVSISKTVSMHINVTKNFERQYSVLFNNEIEPNSIHADDFTISLGSTDNKLYDDGEGDLYISYVSPNANQRDIRVGSVDYETGELTFTVNFIGDSNDKINVHTRPAGRNFHIEQNNVVRIVDCETQEIVK